MRREALVAGQALQERRPVGIGPERQEVDRVALDVLVPVLDDPWSSTCAALSRETFGMALLLSLGMSRGYEELAGAS